MSLDWANISPGGLPPAGPVAFDADLSAANILAAASHGLYCFPASSDEEVLVNEIRYASDVEAGGIAINSSSHEPYSVAWLCPDPRPVVDLTARRTGRTMRKFARRRAEWRTTVNVAFDEVVAACSTARGTTWITAELRAALHELRQDGVAHSCEVWDVDRLIGGVFGLQLGAVFTADSQFTRVEGAGKIAVVDLMTRFYQGGGALFDVQHDTEHTRALGAALMPRASYLDALARLRTRMVRIPYEDRSAVHIAELVTT